MNKSVRDLPAEGLEHGLVGERTVRDLDTG
jgi:hypothetical protein